MLYFTIKFSKSPARNFQTFQSGATVLHVSMTKRLNRTRSFVDLFVLRAAETALTASIIRL
jgi:hypothetical protein